MGSGESPLFSADCMVCGCDLIYGETVKKTCYYCGQTFLSNANCSNNHYICDRCHSSTSIEIIERVCNSSNEPDAALLMQAIRSHKAFSVHGPEHHSLVPAVILTALKNNGSNVSFEQIGAAIQRGQAIPGGACASWGSCGAAVGAGIAVATLLEASPYDGVTRQFAQQATAAALSKIALYSAARCCQRDSWLALWAVSKFLNENLALTLPVAKVKCQQYEHNKFCIREGCPLWNPDDSNPKTIYKTWSVCPTCMERIPAQCVQVGREVLLRKSCKEHGSFENIIWRGFFDMNEWVGGHKSPSLEDPDCSSCDGLCPSHLQKTCCVILNVTDRCNLSCRFCFANQGDSDSNPSFEAIRESLFKLVEKGKTLVQLSGGEPTMRDDLPDIVRAAKEVGARYVQLNSNGIRLAEDIDYVKKLADAGLSFVFMQFDGTNDEIYENLRGKPLLNVKQKAIENCAEFNIGVTLVPTLVRGINTDNIGEVLHFAIANSPKIRGVHFQPVSYIGRIPHNPLNVERFTLDELLFEIQRQTMGAIKVENLLPSACDHPLCGFHGDFVIDQSKAIPLLTLGNTAKSCCCIPAEADKNREFVARRWQRPPVPTINTDSCCSDIHDMDTFLNRVKSHGFTITAMAFQDAGNIDFSRLRSCSLHVYSKGKLIPFCAHYLTPLKQ